MSIDGTVTRIPDNRRRLDLTSVRSFARLNTVTWTTGWPDGAMVASARVSAAARIAVAACITALAVGGCAPSGPTSRRPDGSTPTTSTSALRTDREPIAKRFPALGDFVEVHWWGAAAGEDSGRVPGPTDVQIQAVVVLRPEVATAAASQYEFQPAPAEWDAEVRDDLRPFLPAAATWQMSEQFTMDVRTSRYSGRVYLDTTGGVVYLDVLGG